MKLILFLLKKKNYIVVLFFFLGILTRLPLIEKYHTHTDSSSLVIGITNYNLQQETPAPPGYPLYFFIGYIFNFLTNDPHFSLLLVSVIFSGIGAVSFYIIGRQLNNNWLGPIMSLLFLTSPSFYFLGLTVYPYLLTISILPVLIFIVYKIWFKKKKYGIILGFVYALLIGVRPQELITTFPLFLSGICFLKSNERLKAIVIFITIILLWLVPFLFLVGGLEKYIEISTRAAKDAIPSPSFTQVMDKKFELLNGLYLTLGSSLFFVILFCIQTIRILFKNHKRLQIDMKKIAFCLIWVFPSVLFNLFVRTEHVGYQAAYLIFLLFLAAITINKYSKRKFFLPLIFFVLTINLFIFFYNRDPNFTKTYRQSSFHYTDIRRNDYVLRTKIDYIKEKFNHNEFIIISGPYLWRHIRYYLPKYQTYSIDLSVNMADTQPMAVRKIKNFTFSDVKLENKSMKIPSKIKGVIFFDDEMNEYIKTNHKTIRFKGITNLSILDVKVDDILRFNYHKIILEKKNENL